MSDAGFSFSRTTTEGEEGVYLYVIIHLWPAKLWLQCHSQRGSDFCHVKIGPFTVIWTPRH